ncbi:amino acid ABC transporter substrate-binding protein [Acaryochloris sp. IP29b_bin.148]|uniref:amino acid ABC transporter substrate-binding protein n=1 Tax=Acaryochloris sp. IP29b_bin.148 TaxID=2969218 RepID=UPI00261BE12A|nr:amino acid ABC transporter substrate-binding protein [Acaryochloris sp. IP29b_bin.148]
MKTVQLSANRALLPLHRGVVTCIAIATGLLGVGSTPHIASAETVLEKVSRTGTLTAGTNREALPFAFANEQGELQGYSVDMLKLIQSQLAKELGKPVELKLVALTPEARIPKLMAGEVDIVCDASSYTWERERQIDFSVSYGLTGTRLLAKKGTVVWEPENLVGKRIAAVAGTTNEMAMRRQQQVQVVPVQDHDAGYDALKQGTVDAFAADGILLEGWLQTIDNPADFVLAGYYSKEGIACMVPENNSKFVDQVNYTLVRFMEGYLKGKEPYVTTFDRWFGPQAKVPLSKDLRGLVLETMQLVIDFKEEIPEDDL